MLRNIMQLSNYLKYDLTHDLTLLKKFLNTEAPVIFFRE